MAALLLVPAVVLALLETGLRLFGYGYDTSFFRQTVVGGQQVYVENDKFGRRFFPPQLARATTAKVFKVHKAPGTLRIFVLGESAALGDPNPRFAASRYLEVLLRGRFPNQQFEVINTGVTAINSHAILPIARECAGYDGDLWIVYMGNNEMVGPYGAATVFGSKAPPTFVVRLSLAVQRLRLGQLSMDLLRHARTRTIDEGTWGGMGMFLKNALPPKDPKRKAVYRSFRANLRDILKAGLNSGVTVVLSTVAVNQRDCSPFASLEEGLVPENERPTLAQLRTNAATAMAKSDFLQAQQDWEQALRIAPLLAGTHFLLGQSALKLQDTNKAAEHFQAAVDLDQLPFRADSAINSEIRSAAAAFTGKSLALCEAAAELARAGAGHISGSESFYEHVHLNFDGNYRLAVAWADKVALLAKPASAPAPASPWLAQAECERRLALTDWNRVEVCKQVIARLEQPPLSAQLEKPDQVQFLETTMRQLRTAMTPDSQARARQLCREAIAANPEDFQLHENYADFLEAIGDYNEAVAERTKVRDLIPHNYFPHYLLGMALKDQRRFPEALKSFLSAAARCPTQPEVRLQLGSVYALLKQWPEALKEFERGRKLDAGDARFAVFAADVLWKLDRRDEAIRSVEAAIPLAPSYPESHYKLAEFYAQQGRIAEAAAEFREVLRLRPAHLKARVNLAIALLNQNKDVEALEHINEALRIDPQNKAALEVLARLRARP